MSWTDPPRRRASRTMASPSALSVSTQDATDYGSIVASLGSSGRIPSSDEEEEDNADDNENQEDVASDLNTEESYDESEDDPLGVKKLALSFDYLVYKISERVESLTEQTELSVNNRKLQVDKQLIDVDKSIENLKKLISTCDELDMEFSKVEQISYIVSDFKDRIRQVEHYFNKN